jgi:DNA-binding CsgD family transcriptional regulator
MMNSFGLSKREDEVADLLLEGKSNKQMAVALYISESTVEFHLTNIYAKLNVSSRAEAIIRLSSLRKTPGVGSSRKTGVDTGLLGNNYGESPVETDGISADNTNARVSSIPETPDMSKKPGSFFDKYKIPLSVGAVLALAAIIVFYLSTLKPKGWKKYERECEYPDAATVGQTIGRSNASGSNVHGQFGTTNASPWPALAGFVIYKNITTPKVDQLYLKVRYSKNSPTSVSILIFMDDETNPRAAFSPRNQGNWNQFSWTEPIYLGSIESGVHSIKFATDGQQYGVADLDKFILTAGSP